MSTHLQRHRREERKRALKRTLRRMLDRHAAKKQEIANLLGVSRQALTRMLDDDETAHIIGADVVELDEALPGFLEALRRELGKPERAVAPPLLGAFTCAVKEMGDVANAGARTLSGTVLPAAAEQFEREADEAVRAINEMRSAVRAAVPAVRKVV